MKYLKRYENHKIGGTKMAKQQDVINEQIAVQELFEAMKQIYRDLSGQINDLQLLIGALATMLLDVKELKEQLPEEGSEDREAAMRNELLSYFKRVYIADREISKFSNLISLGKLKEMESEIGYINKELTQAELENIIKMAESVVSKIRSFLDDEDMYEYVANYKRMVVNALRKELNNPNLVLPGNMKN